MEKQFVKRLKLPKMSRFASTVMEISPYELFFAWVAKQMGGRPVGKMTNASAAWVAPEVDLALRGLAVKWAIKGHKLTKKRARREICWVHLDLSPSTFNEAIILMPDSRYVYVRNDLFLDRT